MPNPSHFQRIVASDVLIRRWLLAIPSLVVFQTIQEINPSLRWLSTLEGLLWMVGTGVLSFSTGFFLAIALAWPLFGPFLMWRGEVNGGPFVIGDRVMVIAGRYANRVSTVYSTWQHDTVRVALGGAAESRFEDIFAGYQLLRAEPPKDEGPAERKPCKPQDLPDCARSP
jgi:hypothetical protein